jgi:hypothetical protein
MVKSLLGAVVGASVLAMAALVEAEKNVVLVIRARRLLGL